MLAPQRQIVLTARGSPLRRANDDISLFLPIRSPLPQRQSQRSPQSLVLKRPALNLNPDRAHRSPSPTHYHCNAHAHTLYILFLQCLCECRASLFKKSYCRVISDCCHFCHCESSMSTRKIKFLSLEKANIDDRFISSLHNVPTPPPPLLHGSSRCDL